MRGFDPVVGIWVSIAAMAGHLAWAYAKGSGAPISAGGAFVIVIGVIVIARSLLRLGDQKVELAGRTIMRQVREVDGQLVSATPDEDHQRRQDAQAEFRIGPALVGIGTLINGYGSIVGDCLFAAQGCLLR